MVLSDTRTDDAEAEVMRELLRHEGIEMRHAASVAVGNEVTTGQATAGVMVWCKVWLVEIQHGQPVY